MIKISFLSLQHIIIHVEQKEIPLTAQNIHNSEPSARIDEKCRPFKFPVIAYTGIEFKQVESTECQCFIRA